MAHVLAKDLRSSVIKAAISGGLTETDNVHDFVINTVSDDLVPFEIKDNWGWASFDDVFSFKGGFAFKSSNYIKDSSNQVIRLGNVKNNLLITEEKQVFISDNDAKLAEKYKIQKNDILITMTGTRGKKDYLFSVLINELHLKRNLYLNQRVGCFRCKENILPEYAIIVLKCEEILNLVFDHETGTANQGNIGTTEFKKYLYIPLPPIEEQARIVARVDELMAKIDEYEKLENELVELKKNFPGDMKAAVLQAAMQGRLTEQLESDSDVISKYKKIIVDDDNVIIPNNWVALKLKDVATHQNGKAFKPSDWSQKGMKIIRIQNLTDPDAPANYCDSSIVEKKFVISNNDVLVSWSCTIDAYRYLGETAALNQHIFKVIFDKADVDSQFYIYAIKSLLTIIDSQRHGSTMTHITKTDYENLSFPLPPIEEQRRIVEKLDKILPLCEELEKEIA